MKIATTCILLITSLSCFAQETLQSVTDRGNTTSNGIIANGPSNLFGIDVNLYDQYTKEITPIGFNLNIANGAHDARIQIPFSSSNNNIRLWNTGLNIDRYLGIGTNNPQSGLQMGELSSSYLDKQILIPGTYNFEQMRFGQMGNGNMEMEFVNHSSVNSSYGVRWLVDTDHGAPGLQLQYALDQTGYNLLNYQTGFFMSKVGNIGIGTINPAFKLDVLGTIRSREIKVDMNGADFVFDNNYKLLSLKELEKYIQKEKHLPEIASAKDMEVNGVELGKLNSKLLQKVEEMSLYIIQQQKEIEKLKEILVQLNNKLKN